MSFVALVDFFSCGAQAEKSPTKDSDSKVPNIILFRFTKLFPLNFLVMLSLAQTLTLQNLDFDN
ncbi:hypothetical protein FC62_GL001213 [Amylolactobacillus amylotrophicus DSM 20534]|uniref:Uncharacterized protein n=1 Tax=Amylolactobacillus amylotrophicus DSM 20534 TaxID=1423722 RepID=A0A0R1GUI0_9LACO|nr:hypothetical protein FC62_GL001213 [Amylolactobacillus amylotrophicus DSM 20534]